MQFGEDCTAKNIAIEIGSPIFRIERTTYRAGKQPIDYELLHYRGDLIQFVTRLARSPAAHATPKDSG